MTVRRSLMSPLALAAALCMTVADARAADDPLYPDWSGGWTRVRDGKHGNWDPDKPRGLGQEAPLTGEYQARYEANLAAQARGGQGENPGYRCQPHGMPRIMNADHPVFFAVTPEATYLMRDISNQFRRVYTDGRDWPAQLPHSANGYSIGKWLDTGRRRPLRHAGDRDPRAEESPQLRQQRAAVPRRQCRRDQGAAVHRQGRSRGHAQRDHRDRPRADPPLDGDTSYRHVRDPQWLEYVCAEDNHHVVIGKEEYLVSQDGFLMPTRKDQQPPALRDFDPPRR